MSRNSKTPPPPPPQESHTVRCPACGRTFTARTEAAAYAAFNAHYASAHST